jgi:uncharacterized protein (DUF1015 family)
VPQLLPFRGLRYARPATDYSALICPPYDVISPADRERLAGRDPANAVHVELPASYLDAARLLTEWQQAGTLQRDVHALVYPYEQQYRLADSAARRARGLICLLGLEQAGRASVRRHEHTLAGPKEDRFRLMQAVRANLSPIVLLYQAPAELAVEQLLDGLMSASPVADAVDDAGTRHRLWAVDPTVEPAAARLLAGVANCPLTIADGHHRYQTALRFHEQVGGPGSERVLALLVEADGGGLSVLPTHRLVSAAGVDVLTRAAAVFDAERVTGAAAMAAPAHSGEIGLWTRDGALRLRPRDRQQAHMAPSSAIIAGLDVAVLDAAYPALFGASAEQLTVEQRISYVHADAAAVAAVRRGSADAAFLLAPPPISTVLAVAAGGEVMPPKSTFFYPKAATGLVFNLLAP